MATLAPLDATAPSAVILSSSIGPVAESASASPSTANRPYISRRTLTAAEAGAPLDFEIVLKMRNLAELQSRVNRGAQIPKSEMAANYEPSAADYEAVVAWARSQGFTITHQDSRHVTLFLRAKISHIAQALNVQFARVMSEGKEYSSAITAPSVPSTLSPLLIGVNGLQPHRRAHKHLVPRLATPNLSGGGTAPYYPSQIAQAYGAASLYGGDITGAGQTIAIVIDTFPLTQDLLQFWKNAGVNQSISNIAFIQPVIGALPAPIDYQNNYPLSETTFDTEWSSAIAPGAHVRVYAATELAEVDLDSAYQQVLDDVENHPEYGIHQLSMSYGLAEAGEINAQGQSAQLLSDDQTFSQLAAAGVTCFAASGDEGSTPLLTTGTSTTQQDSVQVEAPADDPNVTGVGGTTLILNANNNISSETAWNNLSLVNGQYQGGASGGGESAFFVHPPSSSSNPSATWQTGLGVSGTMRQVPDVASSANAQYGAYVYVGGNAVTYGGTSWGAPTWAGFCALINQALANAGKPPLGGLNSSIYAMLNSTNYASNFHDIASGNNDTIGNNGYSAGTGYDMVTGVGTPNVQPLLQTLLGSSTIIGTQMPVALVSTEPGVSAAFSAGSANASATYQWQELAAGTMTWSNLADGASFNGSATPILTVSDPSLSMNGDQFRCLITLNGTNVITSTPSVLEVQMPMTISTLAGMTQTTGTDNGVGTAAQFGYPSGLALDRSNNIYDADFSNNQIREITPTGTVTTPYGYLSAAAGTNNGVGNNAAFNNPNAVAFDTSGNLYVADSGNNLVRKISSGTVTTFGPTQTNVLNVPEGIAVGPSSGNVYVADTGNDVIRKITPGGTMTTLAGVVGVAGYTNGAASVALFNQPIGLAVDGAENVYVADNGNSVIRKISTGTVTTLAGQPTVYGYLDGPGATALFSSPFGLAIDSATNLYVADSLLIGTNATGNNLLREVTPSGVVSTLAGLPGSIGSTNGIGSAAQFNSIQAAVIGTNGTAYIADTFNQLIREGIPVSLPTVTIAATQPNALVFGPTPGQFTVTRTGPVTSSLYVSYTVSGSSTAVSGTDFNPLGGSVTIPAGSASAVISVTPIEDSGASSPTVVLSLSPDGYTIGNPGSATVTIQELTPIQSWKTAYFGSSATNNAIGGDSAAPSGNGVANLLSYAFASNPLQPGANPLPVLSTTQIGNQSYITVTYTQINNDPSVTCTPQVTSDVSGISDSWHSGSNYTTNVVGSPVVSGTTTQYTVRDLTPLSAATKRFIRVQVTGP